MSTTQFGLFATRRFLPLFVTQFLGALNDNLFKNALAILIVFDIAVKAGIDGQVLATVAGGVFMLPFFLFSATAGQLADKLDKGVLIRWVKGVEILVMGLAAWGFWLGDAYVLIGILFLMGVQSAFFGPVKYAILPQHLDETELIGGNALIEGGTFLAILVGTIAGGLLIRTGAGTMVVSVGLVGVACLGWLGSLGIPRAPAADTGLRLNPNMMAETVAVVRQAAGRREVFLAILGISWFWLVGATFLIEMPAFARNVAGGDEQVVTLFLAIFSVGIGIGSLLCNRLLRSEISARTVPFAAIAMTIFMVDLFLATAGRAVPVGGQMGAGAFLSIPGNWRMVGDLLGMAVCGGLYIVPLYAIMQARSEESCRSRIIAANNILNALFMVAGALAATVMLGLDFSVPQVFLAMAAGNGVVAVYICRLLPDAVVKALLGAVLKVLFRVEVRGLEKYAGAGERALVVVNHVSFLDAVLLAAFLPGRPVFAVDTRVAGRWWIKPFLGLVEAFPVDPTDALATKSLIKAIRGGRHGVIFPEGRVTVTGALMKVYEGPAMIADKADATVVPVRIDGAQYSPFSRLRGKVRMRLFPRITITVLEPRRLDLPAGSVGRARRQLAGMALYDLMSEMIFETCDARSTVFDVLLDARAVHGGRRPIVEDIGRQAMGYDRLLLRALVLGRRLNRFSEKGEAVGVLLPNSVGAAVTFLALQSGGRVPAMLNFSAGAANMTAAVTAAEVRTVLTSRRFVEMAGLGEAVSALEARVRVVYLEDLKEGMSVGDKLLGLISRPFARRLHRRLGVGPDDPAVILFTSGSEGTPKGVVLSHANLLANRYQLAARIDFNPTDTVFNALPIFHSFGLTGGMLLPMLSGIRTFLYPSPLHYRIVPALVYETNATIVFGTDTFLAGYARAAHPYDFFNVRYVFAGAEKVRDDTRRTWADSFGLRILEGYGATETAPVISVNTPMHFKAGTVGRMLPGIRHQLTPVPGIAEGGRLAVSGPNVMLGYLRVENPGVLERPADGGYDTGDIVSVDGQGFVTILGRAKRFAKIAGEMVSLSAVEGHAGAVWPGRMHAVISLPDARKGEHLVLVTEENGAGREPLLAHARDNGIPELMIPKTVRVVERVPVLGSGKVDYVGVRALAEAA